MRIQLSRCRNEATPPASEYAKYWPDEKPIPDTEIPASRPQTVCCILGPGHRHQHLFDQRAHRTHVACGGDPPRPTRAERCASCAATHRRHCAPCSDRALARQRRHRLHRRQRALRRVRFRPGSGCSEPGWFKTEGGGYVCSAEHGRRKNTRCACLGSCASSIPIHRSGTSTCAPCATTPTPRQARRDGAFIYAKRWKGWKGTNYASAASYAAGDPSVGSARAVFHFVDAERTTRGTVLVRENGAVVLADDVHVYPLSKFEGWNLNEAPIPEGTFQRGPSTTTGPLSMRLPA